MTEAQVFTVRVVLPAQAPLRLQWARNGVSWLDDNTVMAYHRKLKTIVNGGTMS